jgi:hypothetical protein
VAGVIGWQSPGIDDGTPSAVVAYWPGLMVTVSGTGVGRAWPSTRPERSRNDTFGKPAKVHGDEDRLAKPKPVYRVPPAPWDGPPVTRRSDARQGRAVAVVSVVVWLVAGAVVRPSNPRGSGGHQGGPPPLAE